MIVIKGPRELELMRASGKVTAAARSLGREMTAPGVTTRDIDREIRRFIKKSGAEPSFLGYGGFPCSACVSLNDEVIHGVPGRRRVREGDIVSIDVGAFMNGFHGDCAGTFPAGGISEEAKRLIAVTRQSFFAGLKFAREGYRVSDISHAIQDYVEGFGYSLVREYVGHGVGKALHEAPEVPNFGKPGHGPRLVRGMTLAIEPMVNMGGAAVRVLDNDWTVVTVDGSLSAHYENTILITDGEPEILTVPEDL
ncbi:MAG: type I methionyl aminopeptidase [Oscillospiraceae bacterium]|nr:type I methionyl aminopeptidase [Oscillospiraceae bacterium]